MTEDAGTFEMIVTMVEPGGRHKTATGGGVFDCPEIRASLQPLDGSAPEDVNSVLFTLMDNRVKVTFEVMDD